jgi:uncharacterized protein YkwD
MALAVALLFGLSAVVTLAAPPATFAWDKESFDSGSEADLVALTNRSRASAGLKALKVDSTLKSVARWRSKDMIDRDYFSHTIPGVGKVWDKLHSIGYCYNVAGENIGWNNYPDDIATAAIHKMFMDSSGHRANILGKTWDVVGIGAYKGPTGKKMWTVLFADKCGSTPAPTPKPTAKPKPKPTAKPTPKPTVKPAPRAATAAPAAPAAAPTPSPTPEPSPVASPSEVTLVPPSFDTVEPSVEPSTAPPSAEPAGDTNGNGAVAMRVVDRTTSDGLLETIVGGVTGFFFGG